MIYQIFHFLVTLYDLKEKIDSSSWQWHRTLTEVMCLNCSCYKNIAYIGENAWQWLIDWTLDSENWSGAYFSVKGQMVAR